MHYPYHLYLTGSPGQVRGLVLGIIAFLVLMAGMLLAIRWLQNRGLGGNGLSRRIRSLDRMMIGRDTMLQLVQIGTKYLLISVGRDGARLISELSAEDLLPVGSGERSVPQNVPENVGFWGRFWHNLKVNMGLSPKGTPYMTPPREEDSPGGETLSFDAVLRQAEKKEMQQSPISEERSGHRHIETPSPHRTETSKPPRKLNYQTSIDRMVALSEPDRLDRRAGIASLSEYAAELESTVRLGSAESKDNSGHTKEASSKLENPIQLPATPMRKTQDKPANREKNIETLLDKIAERQSRYQNNKETDKP